MAIVIEQKDGVIIEKGKLLNEMEEKYESKMKWL